MAFDFSILDSIYEELVVFIAIATGGGVLAYFRNIKKKQDENKQAISNLCKRIWRMERAFGLFIKLNTKQTLAQHPNADVKDLYELVDVILKDEYENN